MKQHFINIGIIVLIVFLSFLFVIHKNTFDWTETERGNFIIVSCMCIIGYSIFYNLYKMNN